MIVAGLRSYSVAARARRPVVVLKVARLVPEPVAEVSIRPQATTAFVLAPSAPVWPTVAGAVPYVIRAAPAVAAVFTPRLVPR